MPIIVLHNTASVAVSNNIISDFFFITFPSVKTGKKRGCVGKRLGGRVTEGEMRNNRNIVHHQSIQLHDDILLSAKSFD